MFKIAFLRRLQQNENKYVSVKIQIQMDTQQFLKFHRSLLGLHVGGLPFTKVMRKSKSKSKYKHIYTQNKRKIK